MATRMKVKLPPFRVTRRSTSGKVSRGIFPRLCGLEDETKSTTEKELEQEDKVVSDYHTTVHTCEEAFSDKRSQGDPIPSLYELDQKNLTESWRKTRSTLLKIVVESEALPEDQLCTCSNTAVYRCLQCGPRAYFCKDCYEASHMTVNIFHTGEIWENGAFRPVKATKTVDVRSHSCSSVIWTPICCIAENGEEYDIRLATCTCEPLVSTLVRARLWPSAPQRPHLAFTFELLDWMEALLLEAQVSLNDFCKALRFKCRHLSVKRKGIYSSLIEAFEEYRWMKVELRHLSFICQELDEGNVCPACPKECGSWVLSLDAVFGLPRKIAAGKSHRDPLHGHVYFGNQSSVDEFVATYKMPRQKEPQVCNNFLAGDSLRSCRRYHRLDETAVFGCACRHEFPLFFINLKHGERLSYVVWILEELASRIPSGIHAHVMYDVACTLVQHLKGSASGQHLLECYKFALPSFHAFGHNASCQAIYGPSNCEGIGLSDGEVMERLWSYLRPFSQMTKEMRPSHRIDILTHALLYYGQGSKQKLPSLLSSRMKKAAEMLLMARQNFQLLCGSLPVPVTDDVVKEWMVVLKETLTHDVNQQHMLPTWRYVYFVTLQAYYIAKDDIVRGDESIVSKSLQLSSLDGQLTDIEKRFDVSIRWRPTDEQYIETKLQLLKEKKANLRASLWSSVVRRHYLLRMKAKYADGQKIAKKLGASITKETKVARKLLGKYNLAVSEFTSDDPVVLEDVLSLKSEFWTSNSPTLPHSSIPWKTKEEIVQAFVLMKRCEEEKELLKLEMVSTVQYWFHQTAVIAGKLDEMDSCAEDQYSRGLKSLLQSKRQSVQHQYHRATTAFSHFVALPSVTLPHDSEDTYAATVSDSDDESDTTEFDSEDDLEENDFI